MSSITAKTKVEDLPILQLEKRELISIIAHLIEVRIVVVTFMVMVSQTKTLKYFKKYTTNL